MRRQLCVTLFTAFFGLLACAASADTYRVFADAANAGLEWKTVSGAFTAATAAGNDQTIQIEYGGPNEGGAYFLEPMMELQNSGNITIITSDASNREIRADGDHPVFRVNSTAGKTLTITGGASRITLYSEYASPVLDCGDSAQSGGLGNGLAVLTNVYIVKKSGTSPSAPGAPNGVFLRIDNRATGTHSLTNVQFNGGDAGDAGQAVVQTDPVLLTGPYHGNTTLHLDMTNVNFTPALGAGTRLHIKNIATITATNCTFAPQGDPNSESAVAVWAETTTALNGGTVANFHNCHFKSGEFNLFSHCGESVNSTPNQFNLYQPVFTGKCGETAFHMENSGATVSILGTDSAHPVSMDPMISGGTGAYAVIHKGGLVFQYVTGSVAPSLGAGIISFGNPLESNVNIDMSYCIWANGAGTYRCGASGGNFGPHFTAFNTVFRGGNVSNYINTSGSQTGIGVIRLRHCTLAGSGSTPITDLLVKGNTGDTLYAAATIFDAPGGNGSASASNLVPALETGYEWTNLAWDADVPYGGFPAIPASGFLIANPAIDADTGKLTSLSTGALAGAVSSGTADTTALDFEGDARPLPAAGNNVPDIGADEAQFAPTGVQWITPPSTPGSVGDADPAGTLVGTLEALDPDPGEAHVFELTNQFGNSSGDPDSRFQLSNGNQVEVMPGAVLNAADGAYTIYVLVTDSSGATLHDPAILTVAVTDTTAPHVSRVSVIGAYQVEVEFSESMATGVANASKYTLSGSGAGSLATQPVSATQTSPTVVLLSWPENVGEMVDGGPVTITVDASVTDISGNLLTAPLSATDATGGIGTKPSLASIAAQSASTIQAAFSETLRAPESTDPLNYTLSGTGIGTLAAHPSTVSLVSGTSYLLTWASGAMSESAGATVTLTVTGVYDPYGNLIDTTGGNNEKSTSVFSNPPSVTALATIADRTMNLTFSKEMDDTAGASYRITNPANFTLSNGVGTGGMGTLTATPSSVTQVSGTNTYQLAWATGEMYGSGLLKITVDAAVRDTSGNLIQTRQIYGEGKGTAPRVSEVRVMDKQHIKLIYSEAMASGVTTPAKYTLSGAGQGTLSATPNQVQNLGSNTYKLTWTSGALTDGGDILVVVLNNNVKDLAGNLIGTVSNRGSVTNRIAITTPPSGAMKYVGGSHTLSVAITGGRSGQVVYQWVKVGAKDLVMGSGPSLTLSPLQLSDAGTYRCDVSDGREEIVSSTQALLEVADPMSIAQEPESADVVLGNPCTFTLAVNGGHEPLTYQWKHGMDNVGPDAPVYTLSQVTDANAGVYSCLITDATGSTISSSEVQLDVYTPMHIDEQPSGGEFAPGAALTLHVSVSGGRPPMAYQWKRNEVNIGDNAPTFEIPAVNENTIGAYTVEISDQKATISSVQAVVAFQSEIPVAGVTGLALLAALLGTAGRITLRRRR